MNEYDTGDLIACHLLEVESGTDGDRYPRQDPASYERSVPGLAEALDLGSETVADRIDLLSAISDLQRAEEIAESVGPIRGLGGERNRYHLTEAGRRRARSVLDSAADRSVTVVGPDGERTRSVRSAADRLEDGSVARLLSRLDSDGRYSLAAPTEGEFVDRDGELQLLASSLEAVADGTSRTVRVTGPEGIGKTELVEEFRRRVVRMNEEAEGGADRPAASFAAGSPDRDAADPYGPYGELLADLGIDRSGVELLEPPDRTAPDDRDDLRARRRAAFDDVATLVADAAEAGPVVAFLDDLQWADSATLRLTEYLASELDDAGVLLVLVHREEWVQDGDEDSRLERLEPVSDRTLELTGLDRAATRSHVEWLVGRRDVPDEFVDVVHEATGGNPLFVREVVTRAVADGELDPARGMSPDLDAFTVPDTVRRIVDERLRDLDETATAVVRTGAVVGRFVPRSLLVEAVDAGPAEVLDYADLLVEGRIWEREADRDGYRFTSEVIREAVLDGTDDGHRRAIHRRVGESILEVYPDERAGWYGDVAGHFEAAGDRQRALEYRREAAERAWDVYATDVAREEYESALELARELDAGEQVLELLESLGEIAHLTGELEAAERHFEYVRERAGDPDTERRMLTNLSRVALHRGDHERAVELAERGLQADDGTGTDDLRCDLLSKKGWALLQQGEYEGAAGAFERERDLAEELDDEGHLARAAHDLGTLRFKRGRWEAALPLLEEAVERHERNEESTTASSLTNLGAVHWKLGDLEAAADCFERALEHQREVGDERGRLSTLTNLGVVSQTRGDWDRSLEHYERSLEIARGIGDKRSTGVLLSNAGSILVSRLELERAGRCLGEAIDLTESIDNRTGLDTALGNYARLELYRRNFEAALDYARRRTLLGEEVGDPAVRAKGIGMRASVFHERGDLDAAANVARERIDLAREHDHDKQLVAGALQLARIEADAGDPDGAREALDVAEDRGEHGSAYGKVRLALTRGVVDAAEGHHHRALDHYRPALDDAHDLKHVALECMIRLSTAESLVAVGEAGAASGHLDAVVEACEGTGATLFETRARERLDESREGDG